jgi:hypothetical protein
MKNQPPEGLKDLKDHKNFKALDPLGQLLQSYRTSPEPSYKVTNYFEIYVDLFAHLRGTACTFVEIGVLNGGSLFMWRDWLGKDARIIGIDLNPGALKWREHGFEIYIGDQGNPQFWRETLAKIGPFDALLDDGGHQSFQQIVTVSEAIRAATKKCVIAVEDTITSFMKEFARHREHTFLKYAKDSTDYLPARMTHFNPGESPKIDNKEGMRDFQSLYSVAFYAGLVAFKIDPASKVRPELCWNRPLENGKGASDFRYQGRDAALVDWPDPFMKQQVILHGGPA